MKSPHRLCRHVSSLTLLLLLLGISGSAAAQGSKMASPTAPIEDADQDNPSSRGAWLMKGRTAPAGQSAAAPRYRAHQQKMHLPALRAQKYSFSRAMRPDPTAHRIAAGPPRLSS